MALEWAPTRAFADGDGGSNGNDAHGVIGRSYQSRATTKEGEAEQDARNALIASCPDLACVEHVVGSKIQGVGADVGAVVRTLPAKYFDDCRAALGTAISSGVQCLQRKVDEFGATRGLSVLDQVHRQIYEGGKHAANFKLDQFPPQFAAKVRANCGKPALTDEYDICVSDQADSERMLIDDLRKKLTNADNVAANRAQALAVCGRKFGKDACAKTWGESFKLGFDSSTGATGGVTRAQAGDPNGSDKGTALSKPDGPDSFGENLGKDARKCPSYIPSVDCQSGTIRNVRETAKHWRKGSDGKYYFSAEELPIDGQPLGKIAREVGETNFLVNKGDFEKELVNRVADQAIAKYLETVYLDGHVTGAQGNAADFALIAQRLKGQLPAKGCGPIAGRIDALVARAPRPEGDPLRALKKKHERDAVLAARCLSATQARLNVLEKKLGFVGKDGQPIVMTRSVIRQEDIDQLTYQAMLKGKQAAQKLDNQGLRRGGEFVAETGALTGQALVNMLTDLPLVRQLLKEAPTMVDKEGLGSCRGLAAINDRQCREDLREFQEHFARLNSFYKKNPALSGMISSGGRQIPAYEAVAGKTSNPATNLSAACEPALGLRPTTADEEPGTAELAALGEAQSQGGAQVLASTQSIESLLGKLCDPGVREDIAQLALDNPEFMRSFFGCEDTSFGRLAPGRKAKLPDAACRERIDYGLTACHYFGRVKDWEVKKEIGGQFLAIAGDLMVFAGGSAAPAFARKAIAGGIVVGGGLGAIAAPSSGEAAARHELGALFCESGYGASIKDCARVFADKKQFDQAIYSPKFKGAFQGAVQGGVFGALAPGEVAEALKDPRSLIDKIRNRPAAGVPEIQGPRPANVGVARAAAVDASGAVAETKAALADAKAGLAEPKAQYRVEHLPTGKFGDGISENVRLYDASGEQMGKLSYSVSHDGRTLDVKSLRADIEGQGLGTQLYTAALEKYPNVSEITGNLTQKNSKIYWEAIKEGKSHLEALMETPSYKIRANLGYGDIDLSRSLVHREGGVVDLVTRKGPAPSTPKTAPQTAPKVLVGPNGEAILASAQDTTATVATKVEPKGRPAVLASGLADEGATAVHGKGKGGSGGGGGGGGGEGTANTAVHGKGNAPTGGGATGNGSGRSLRPGEVASPFEPIKPASLEGSQPHSPENPWGHATEPGYRRNLLIDGRDHLIIAPEITYRGPAPGQTVKQMLAKELGTEVKPLMTTNSKGVAKEAAGGMKSVFVNPSDSSQLLKAFDPSKFANSADVVKQVQRELAYHALLKSMGIPVAELVETPAAKKLWSRGVITYKRSPGTEVGNVFGQGQFTPGRYPKLDGLISRVEAMKPALVRLTGEQYGVMLSNEVPMIPRFGVEVTPKKVAMPGGGSKTVYIEAVTGKELARGELNAHHYYPVSKNGVTLYNTPMGVDVGFNFSNIFVDEATGHVELIDF